MRTVIISAATVALLVSTGLAVEPLPADDARIKDLGNEDAARRVAASGALVKVGAPAVVPLLGVMDGGSKTAGKMAYGALFKLVQQAAGTDGAADVAGELTRELANREHKVSTRRQICRLLSFIGDDACVDALYRALNERDLAEMARFALARIPTPRATQALIGGLQLFGVEGKVALIRVLGRRQERGLAPALYGQTQHRKPEVRAAAIQALARIPDPLSLKAIDAAVANHEPGAVTAMLTLCERMIDEGMTANALKALQKLEPMSGLTQAERCRLLHALARTGEVEAVTRVVKYVTDASPRVRGAAVQACALMPGPDATAVVVGRMARATGTLKVDLLEVLGRRGKWMTEASAREIVKAVEGPDEAVRVAAIGAIEHAGIASGVPVLLKSLAGPAGPARDAAECALNHMPGGDAVTHQILDQLDKAPPGARAAMVLALGHRGGNGVLPALIKAARGKDASVRRAAYRAMGVLGDAGAFDALLAGLRSSDDAERQAAGKALRRLDGEAVSRKMAAVYEDATTQQKAALLRVIGWRKDPTAQRLLAREVKSDDATIRAAAVEGLGRQDDPAVAPTLLAVAKAGPAEVTRAALDGYLRAARRAEGNDRALAAGMYVEVLAVDADDEQLSQALDGIARTVDPKDQKVLAKVRPFLDRGRARQSAARAAAPLAMALPESRKDEAIAILKRVVALAPDAPTVRKAAEHLRRLGVDVDPGRDAGFVTTWWLVGPFPNPNGEMFTKAYFPEQGIDLGAGRTVDGKEYAWKRYRTGNLNGVVDLALAVADRINVGAYGYAEIRVDEARDALLKIGSDDGIVVWLNGKQVLAINAARGLKVDEDQAEVRLEAGVNRILVKCLNGQAAWAFCLRVTTLESEPVRFTQPAP